MCKNSYNCMQKALEIFQEITQALLADEQLNPVAKYIPSAQIYDKLDLSLSHEGTDMDSFKKSLKDLVLATPRTATNAFFNQLFGGRNETAVLGDLLAVILNNSMYTYKAGGPMIAIEKEIIRNITDLLGWDDKSDGTLAAGGSMTNFKGILMARDAFDPKIRHKGGRADLVLYTSEESHYSIPKNTAFAGIGRDNVRKIPADSMGRMDVKLLRQAIIKDKSDGLHPIMVNATAGTTVLAAFDPFEEIAEVCAEYNIWMHIDGAYCGSAIFSDKYRHLLKGANLADSFTLNAHKMLGTPLSCSIIVVKDKKHLHGSFSNDASYLYQTDADDFNPGKISLQCGRRNDALKFWALWKSIGTKGLGELVDKQFHLGEVSRNYILNNPDYKLYSFDDSIGICYNYKDISARDICTALYEKSELMVGYGSFHGTEFIRFVTINYGNDEADILRYFKQVEEFVEKEMQ